MSSKVKIILILLIMITTTLIASYNQYRKSYEMCAEYNYVYPVDCTTEISFQDFQSQYSFFKYALSMLKPQNIWDLVSILMFSPFTYVAVTLIAMIIFWESKEKNNNQKNISRKENIKLFFGFLPFILMIIHGIITAFKGFTFLFSTSYGLEAFITAIILDFILLLPINVIAIVLIASALTNKKKNKILSNENSINQQ